jgi:hypothetical protein
VDESHVPSSRVLDPEYVADLEDLSLDDLHRKQAESLELETEVSYARRVAQGRIDILEAELDRRARGASLGELIEALPSILADEGPRASPAASRLPIKLAPEHDSDEWGPRLSELETVLVALPDLSEEQLRDSMAQLRSLEREMSTQRRALHEVLTRIDGALAQRITTGAT